MKEANSTQQIVDIIVDIPVHELKTSRGVENQLPSLDGKF